MNPCTHWCGYYCLFKKNCASPASLRACVSYGRHWALTTLVRIYSCVCVCVCVHVHVQVHPRHHSDQHPDPLSDAALQGRYKVDFDYFGIGILPAPPPSAARGVQEEEQAAGRDVRLDVSGDGGLRGSEEATAEEEAGMESQRFGTLEELNAYLRSQEPVGGAVGAVGAGEASCSGAPLRSELEVETPDVPWRVGGDELRALLA